MDVLSALGLSLPAGLNAYIPLLAVAAAQRLGWLKLNEPLDMLGEWWAIGLIAVLLIIELVADKVPAVDSVNDVIQTVVRPAAGGILAVGASGQVGQDYPVVVLVGGILLAGAVHATKAAARPVVNATTGGTGGPVVSLVEDVAAVIASAIAILVPVLVVFVMAAVVLFAWWVFSRRRKRAA